LVIELLSILVLDVSLRSFYGTEPPSPSDIYTPFGRYLSRTQILLCGRRFPTLCMGNELNKDLEGKSVPTLNRQAISRLFPKFCLRQNFSKSWCSELFSIKSLSKSIISFSFF